METGVFVTFYDANEKKSIKQMVELPSAPCSGDVVKIGKEWYKVIRRGFVLEKRYRIIAFVTKTNNPMK